MLRKTRLERGARISSLRDCVEEWELQCVSVKKSSLWACREQLSQDPLPASSLRWLYYPSQRAKKGAQLRTTCPCSGETNRDLHLTDGASWQPHLAPERAHISMVKEGLCYRAASFVSFQSPGPLGWTKLRMNQVEKNQVGSSLQSSPLGLAQADGFPSQPSFTQHTQNEGLLNFTPCPMFAIVITKE